MAQQLRPLVALPEDLYHLHKIGFKIVFMCFRYVGMFTSCCSRIAGLWWCHIALSVVDCVLTLTFRHLGLGWL